MIDHVWHWQQWYFIIAWGITFPINIFNIARENTQEKRVSLAFTLVVASISAFVLWSGGFFG